MNELNSPLNGILLVNSLILVTFILNQNDSARDAITNQTSTLSQNPFEKFTWFSIFFQFSLLLIKIKTNDF